MNHSGFFIFNVLIFESVAIALLVSLPVILKPAVWMVT